MARWIPASCVFLIACGSASATEPDLGPEPPPARPSASAVSSDLGVKINPRLLRRFQPLVATVPGDATETARVALGKQLFFEPRISQDRKTSCSSCHELARGGVDGQPTSIGTAGQIGVRNAPTVYNAARHVAQFWDGRAGTLEEQAGGPMLDKTEMGMHDAKAVTTVLRSIPGYRDAFAAAFPGEPTPVDFEHATKALAAFERTLITPGRWDRFLTGDRSALTAAELEGLKVFADIGCVQCHTGDLVGGMMFQRTGLVVPWPNQKDQGRFDVTKLESDRMVFKVPSLRNVTLTAPYFHDGSVTDLNTAIQMMGTHQLGLEVSPAEIASIRAWLETLAGEPSRIDPPVLPN